MPDAHGSVAELCRLFAFCNLKNANALAFFLCSTEVFCAQAPCHPYSASNQSALAAVDCATVAGPSTTNSRSIRGTLSLSRRHLRREKATPHQVVELRVIRFQTLGASGRIGRLNRLVRLLRELHEDSQAPGRDPTPQATTSSRHTRNDTPPHRKSQRSPRLERAAGRRQPPPALRNRRWET